MVELAYSAVNVSIGGGSLYQSLITTFDDPPVTMYWSSVTTYNWFSSSLFYADRSLNTSSVSLLIVKSTYVSVGVSVVMIHLHYEKF